MIAVCTCPMSACAIHGDRPEGVVTVSGNVSGPRPIVFLSPDWSEDRAWASEPSLSAAVAKVIERAKQEPERSRPETM